MKVALLVFPIHYSHGCILQTFALYSKLKELGYRVTIIDRQPKKLSFVRAGARSVKLLVKRLIRGYKGAIFYQGWFPYEIMRNQQHFINSFSEDIKSVYSTEELKHFVEKGDFEAIIVGSDQTWRPCYVPNVMDYWFDFAEDMGFKKITYAPSFGVGVWEYTDSQTLRCKELASLFTGISVREESGVKLCKNYLGIDATHVLDPTLLWTKDFYEPIASQYPMPEGGCHCYFLDVSEEKKKIAESIAQKKGLVTRYINTRTEDGDAPVKERIAPSIEKWLAGFFYGDYIVVDSFHAVIFSIIFQKTFVVIGNKKRGMSRFESILNKLGLQNRLLKETTTIDEVLQDEIDWNSVCEKLDILRNKSITFLKKALSNQ